MDTEQFQRIEALFNEALTLPADRRRSFLAREGGDAEIVRKVERLLDHADRDSDLPDPLDGARAPDPAPDAAPAEAPGTLIGRYKLLEQIGEGGFGVVYMADQERPVRRRVALKIIKLGMDTHQVIARFEAERQALAMMDHPNIAKVLDAGATATGRPFFVMELVRGLPITAYCDHHRLAPRERLELLIRVCKAVQHAHQKGVIHRDLKPSNVLVTMHDGEPVPKVIDFGIAKATEQPLTDRTLFTGFHQFVGTPEYMSPEQAGLDDLDVDTRSDIYSLGVLLYEMLTGGTPFEATTPREASYEDMRRIIREVDPVRPSTRLSMLGDRLADVAGRRGTEPELLRRELRGDLDWIVMKALEKSRTRRYDTAGALARDIQRHLEDKPVVAGPPSARYRAKKFVRRHRVAVTAGLVVASAIIIGAVLATAGLIEARTERNRAVLAKQDADLARGVADRERRDATERLHAALLAQARADRSGRRPGRRHASLQAVRQAAAIEPSAELRDEAIACMMLTDLIVKRRFDFSPETAVSARGLLEIDRFARTSIGPNPDGRIEIIAVDDERTMIELTGPALTVRRMEFSPDGRYLAAKFHTGRERRMLVYDLATGSTIVDTTAGGNGIAFAPDGAWVALSVDDDTMQVYRLPDGVPGATLPTSARAMYACAHPGGRLIAVSSISSAHAVDVWDVEQETIVASFSAPNGVRGVAWSPDGTRLAAGGSDHRLYVWDHAGGERMSERVVKLEGHQGPVIDVYFDTDGRHVYSWSWDSTMRVWDLATKQPLLDPTFEALPCAVADRVLVARTDTIELCRLEREPGHMRLVAPAQLGPDSRIALAGPRDCLVVVGGDTGAFLWNATTGALVATLVDTHARWVCASPAGDRIYAATLADGLLAWSVRETAAGTIAVEGPEQLWIDSDVREISVSADGRLIVGTIGNSVAAFDVEANEERWRLPAFGGVIVPRLSPDGRWLFAGTWKGGAARLFDRLTGETVRTFEGKHVLAEFNDADGSLIVGTGEAFVVHESGTWRAIQPLPRGTREGDQAGKITVNADQTLLALGRTRYVIQLLNSRTYEPLATLWMPDAHMIGNIAFSRDGATMYVTTPGREIHVWDLRAIRRNLRDLGLDWDLPPYAPAETVVPLRIDVVNREPQ